MRYPGHHPRRPHPHTHRAATSPALALAATLTAVLLAGCGTTTDPGAGPSSDVPSGLPSTALPSATPPSTTPPSTTLPSGPAPSPSPSDPSKRPGPGPQDPSAPPAEDAAQLTVVYSADGTKQQTWTLTCAPTGGSHPDPAAACAALSAAGTTPFAPVPGDQQCTQIYGGPQTATVRGTWRGESVAGAFSRTNGCQIDRWRQLEGLLPAV